MTTLQRLDALKLYGTRYECALMHAPSGRKWLLGYSHVKSRDGLLRIVRLHAAKIVAASNSPNYTPRAKSKALDFNSDWSAYITGRTQREAITLGELPDFASAEV